ncbi:hypothetical protein DPMN_100788 [Dreissena polymorpha]|uniref:Uncharacterized protein n=1 Tax=Dreissena polymorpha TaxID=45954 RepID=A0A9D4LI72_DREPO|nr:hypothetical protein DPMN_100788 [Dreissena polymorpha]
MSIFRNLNTKWDGKTDRRTDRRTDSPITICPPTGGIKTKNKLTSNIHHSKHINYDPNHGQALRDCKLLNLNQQQDQSCKPKSSLILDTNISTYIVHKQQHQSLAQTSAYLPDGRLHDNAYPNRQTTLRVKIDQLTGPASQPASQPASPPASPPAFANLITNIIGTNLLTKFHKNQKINVASRENAPPPDSHVFQPTGIIFELVQDIIGMNLLTKFHEDWTVNVASRVLTRFYYYSHVRKNAPPLGSHVFQANIIIFTLIQDIIETNLLTKFHEDWK